MADAPLVGDPAKNKADFGVCPWVANNLVGKTGLGPAGYDARSECSLRVRTCDRQVRATYPGAGQSGNAAPSKDPLHTDTCRAASRKYPGARGGALGRGNCVSEVWSSDEWLVGEPERRKHELSKDSLDSEYKT